MKPTFFKTQAEFRKWLEKHHSTETELLLGFHKVGSGKGGITYFEAVDEALCFGWIDAVRRGLDESSYTIRFTPRKKTSIWSAVNIKKVEALIAAKRMKPAGLAAFEARSAKRSKIYSFEQKEAPELDAEQLRALKANKAAFKFFEAQPPWYRRVVTHLVTSAKKPETRAQRLANLIECCAAGEWIPSMRWRDPKKKK